MTVTVDINVLLDVFQQRQPHYAASAQVLSLVASGKLTPVCPAHGLTTLYYLVRKHAAKADAEVAMDRVLAYFRVGNLDAAGWQRARLLAMDDFEDAAVATVAATSGSVFVITRNLADYFQSPVPGITPAEFLSQHASVL
ncbi:MAG: pilus assembly protein [Verrucomicrobiales bacterium VVV1]|nr:MAG: pilus assembly protein [Verrucomicrobiales bacterium VVV1]